MPIQPLTTKHQPFTMPQPAIMLIQLLTIQLPIMLLQQHTMLHLLPTMLLNITSHWVFITSSTKQ
jgi:hypothetical protein